MSTALWGVVIGGLLTIGGQSVAELLKAHAQRRQRQAERDTSARDFHREAVELATVAAKDLQAVLVEYEGVNVPTAQLELRLRQATSEFERLVPRVKSAKVRSLLESWETAATDWALDEGTQAAESAAWRAAVYACGEAVRGYV